MEPVLAVFARGEIPPGLIFMEGEPWKIIKPIVSPSFSSKKLKLVSERERERRNSCFVFFLVDGSIH